MDGSGLDNQTQRPFHQKQTSIQIWPILRETVEEGHENHIIISTTKADGDSENILQTCFFNQPGIISFICNQLVSSDKNSGATGIENKKDHKNYTEEEPSFFVRPSSSAVDSNICSDLE
jgi:hypothetical protein